MGRGGGVAAMAGPGGKEGRGWGGGEHRYERQQRAAVARGGGFVRVAQK